jgi:hypothetical protein
LLSRSLPLPLLGDDVVLTESRFRSEDELAASAVAGGSIGAARYMILTICGSWSQARGCRW